MSHEQRASGHAYPRVSSHASSLEKSLALEGTDKVAGAKRPGAGRVATCPGLGTAEKATEKQASRQDHPSLH